MGGTNGIGSPGAKGGSRLLALSLAAAKRLADESPDRPSDNTSSLKRRCFL